MELMAVKPQNFQSILKELEDSYFLPEEDIKRIFEETAGEFLSMRLTSFFQILQSFTSTSLMR